MTATKFCSRCFTRKGHDQYHADGRTLDGLSNTCFDCTGRRRDCPACGIEFVTDRGFTYCSPECARAGRAAQREPSIRERKTRALAALRESGVSDPEIGAARLLLRHPDRDLQALAALEARFSLGATPAPEPPLPRPEPPRQRERWGHGLVCDCPVARPRGGKQCSTCSMPVVALMDPELRAVMAVKAPQSVTQQVKPVRERVPA